MASTAELTITLPLELAEIVRAKVADGEFPSESAYIESVLGSNLTEQPADDDFERWLRSTGVERYDAYDADPSKVRSAHQVLQTVAERLHHFAGDK